jgi:hypothetical protein
VGSQALGGVLDRLGGYFHSVAPTIARAELNFDDARGGSIRDQELPASPLEVIGPTLAAKLRDDAVGGITSEKSVQETRYRHARDATASGGRKRAPP